MYDREINLFCNANRDYDPQQGRYVESDPVGLAKGWAPSYVKGNPVSYVDPLGLELSDRKDSCGKGQ